MEDVCAKGGSQRLGCHEGQTTAMVTGAQSKSFRTYLAQLEYVLPPLIKALQAKKHEIY